MPGELIMEGLTQIAVPRPPSPILPFLGWFRDADGGRGVPAVHHLCPLAAEACGRVQGEIPAARGLEEAGQASTPGRGSISTDSHISGAQIPFASK